MSAYMGVDLDGTLAHYDYTNHDVIGEPIELMANRVRKWLSEGITVKIITARGKNLEDVLKIQEWTLKHFGVKLEVTTSKDYAMIQLWDDRAVAVKENTGEALMWDENGEAKLLR